MLDKSAVIQAVLARLDKLPCGHALDLRTYKRNRSVIVLKQTEEAYRIIENGFSQERFTVPAGKLKKTLQKLLKKEFPRSRKVRLYDLGPWDEADESPPKLKTL
ncbi:MAG: hypothetical protein U5L00_14805 [Desulfovermiculus sp.]|nr:hypothetical protein [Desulfovermiculus sp.]